MSKSTNAGSMKKFEPNSDGRLTQPLELGAVCRCPTKTGTASLTLSDQELSICLMGLLVGLQHNVLSSDVWALSHSYARGHVKGLVSKEKYNLFMQRIEDCGVMRRARNPMSSMF